MSGSLAGNAHAAEAAPRPNFIFILADDLGWGDLSCYGNKQIKTPNLDRLAKQGTLFTQFYVNGSVCSPSRCAFMTGQYPARHRIHGHYATHELNAKRGMSNWLDPKVPNVASLLKSAGYATAHFGKWHLGNGEGAPPPTEYGFDDARTYGSNGPGWNEPVETFFAKSTRIFVDETLRFITDESQPAVLREPLDARATRAAQSHRGTDGALQLALLGKRRDAQERRARFITPSSAISTRRLAGCSRSWTILGLATNTLVMFSSDNGPEDIHLTEAGHSGVGSAGPFRGRKRSLYEGGVRVPFIVRWPGKNPAGRVDTTSVVAGVDWLPTVCKLAGIPIPAAHELDGEDVSDIFLGKARGRARRRSCGNGASTFSASRSIAARSWPSARATGSCC